MVAKEIHWADLAAEKLIQDKKKSSYVCASGITPSGVVHIGNFREAITTDLVCKALIKKGKKVRFLYSWDEYDVFRKIPADMPKKEILEKYLRQPIVDVPDVYDCHKSYAEHNEKEFEESLKHVGLDPDFIYQAQKYRACEYAELIKNALQNKERIKIILDKYREEPLESTWYPVMIFCSKCNTDATNITAYDNEYAVSYECECKHKETFDIRKKGIIKLLWRIDWPYRWHLEKVDFEPGGKDHSSHGGSYTTGSEIIKEIFKEEAPEYIMYDFISVKGSGGKISSSKGGVISLKDVLEVYIPEVARWIFASTRPNTEFAISFDVDVISIYEEFDRAERVYFGKEETKSSGDMLEKEKRMYELSSLIIPDKIPFQVGFRHITTILQIHELDEEETINHFKTDLKTSRDKQNLKARVKCAKNWLLNYAPQDFKFTVNNSSPILSLSNSQKEAIKQIIKVLEGKTLTDEALHEEFYTIMKKENINMKEFFTLCYQILINKEKGPKLASFIHIIGKPKSIALFKDAIKN